MAYSKTTWKNGVTKVNADNMNKIEQGIQNAQETADNLANIINSKTLTKSITDVITSQEKIMTIFVAMSNASTRGAHNGVSLDNNIQLSEYQDCDKIILDLSSLSSLGLNVGGNLIFTKGFNTNNYGRAFYLTYMIGGPSDFNIVNVVLASSGGNDYLDRLVVENSGTSIPLIENDLSNYYTKTEVDNNIANLDILKENVSNKTTTLTSSSTHTQYPSAKVVYDRIQDVREVAEGKSNSYVISYSDVVNQDTDFSTNNYYDMYGYRIENYGEVEKHISISALERPSANNDFNSKNDNLVFEDLNRYIIVESSSLFNSEDINGKVILPLEFFISKLRIGDVINIREVNIPDRWYAGNHSFGALETKIDLTTLVNISDDQEINGIKTFNNDIQVRSNIVGVGDNLKIIGEKNLPFDYLYVKYIGDGTNEWSPGDFATKNDVSDAIQQAITGVLTGDF